MAAVAPAVAPPSGRDVGWASQGAATESRHRTRARLSGSAPRRAGAREQHRYLGVLQQEGQSLPRVGRIQRHVGPARLEDGQHAQRFSGDSLQAQPHRRAGADAPAPQEVCELVGPPLQLSVRQRPVPEVGRQRVRCAGGLGLEQLVDAGLAGPVAGGVAPRSEQRLPFILAASASRLSGVSGAAAAFSSSRR